MLITSECNQHKVIRKILYTLFYSRSPNLAVDFPLAPDESRPRPPTFQIFYSAGQLMPTVIRWWRYRVSVFIPITDGFGFILGFLTVPPFLYFFYSSSLPYFGLVFFLPHYSFSSTQFRNNVSCSYSFGHFLKHPNIQI